MLNRTINIYKQAIVLFNSYEGVMNSQFFGVPPRNNYWTHVPIVDVIQMELFFQ